MVTLTGEIVLASRMTNTYGLMLLLRRDPSRYENKPAFGIRTEGAGLRNGCGGSARRMPAQRLQQ